jgi:tetratricopeptide (TPR) repeat protein
MRRSKVFLGVFLIAGVLVMPARGATDAQFAKANEEYAAGHFREAIADYESLVRSGEWSANLFYDLGSAWFRAGSFGEAILNYERALAIDPRHPEAEANLRIARDEARALELRKNVTERALTFATPTQYSIAAAIAFWMSMFFTARLVFARQRTRGLVGLLIISVAIFAGSIFALYSLENGDSGKALAIVTGQNVEARLATADNANSVLALPPGSEIKILSTRGDWVYAALPNDQRGWIPAKSAARVRL